MSFHVPEPARIRTGVMGSDSAACGNNGAFLLPSCEPGWMLLVIASDDSDPVAAGWEHVSVSARARNGTRTRTPNWAEMCQVKDLFWDDEDVVMQLHPRRSVYVNNHPNVLHLWQRQPIPEPPPELVGVLS